MMAEEEGPELISYGHTQIRNIYRATSDKKGRNLAEKKSTTKDKRKKPQGDGKEVIHKWEDNYN